MHRFFKGLVLFIDDLVGLFDGKRAVLAWFCTAVFLTVFGLGALFFAPVEGFFVGMALAAVVYLFVSEWHGAMMRRPPPPPRRKRARSVLIDTSGLKSYSPPSSSRQP